MDQVARQASGYSAGVFPVISPDEKFLDGETEFFDYFRFEE
jgi:hypothetical protein